MPLARASSGLFCVHWPGHGSLANDIAAIFSCVENAISVVLTSALASLAAAAIASFNNQSSLWPFLRFSPHETMSSDQQPFFLVCFLSWLISRRIFVTIAVTVITTTVIFSFLVVLFVAER